MTHFVAWEMIIWLLFLFVHPSWSRRQYHCTGAVSTHWEDIKLQYDQALLEFRVENPSSALSLFTQLETCYLCPLQLCLSTQKTIIAIIDTQHAVEYEVKSNNSVLCTGTYHFKEHGRYLLSANSTYCNGIEVVKPGRNAYIPLFILLGALGVLMLLYLLIVFICEKCSEKKNRFYNADEILSEPYQVPPVESSFSRSNAVGGDSGGSSSINAAPKTSKRIKSLDTFRGIAIIIMIFVNYGGGKYWFFIHATWNGLTVADLVFPWFIFAMGSSIFISTRSLLRKGKTRAHITLKILIRSAKLLALGLFLNNGSDLENWRLPGVLQRFAVSFLIVGLANLWLSPREVPSNIEHWLDWRDSFRDLFFYPFQHILMLLFLGGHIAITFLIHDPQCPAGYLGPGGTSDGELYRNCTGGAAGYIDRTVFGINHIYNHPTCSKVYNCLPYDPEGLLGILTSIFLTYLGLHASRILFLYQEHGSHIKRWLFWSVVWGGIAIGLSGASRDDGVIPINKNLWSVSFIFATGALAYLLLTLCYVLIDVRRLWSGSPFYFPGMNAIFLYVGHEILEGYFPFNFKNDGSHGQLLARAAVGTVLWILTSFHLYREKTFFKL